MIVLWEARGLERSSRPPRVHDAFESDRALGSALPRLADYPNIFPTDALALSE